MPASTRLSPHRLKLVGATLFATLALAPAIVMAQVSSDCQKGGELFKARISFIQKIQALPRKHADPNAACSLFNGLAGANAKVLAWAKANKDWCSIEDQQIAGLEAESTNVSTIRGKACAAAAQFTKLKNEAERAAKIGRTTPSASTCIPIRSRHPSRSPRARCERDGRIGPSSRHRARHARRTICSRLGAPLCAACEARPSDRLEALACALLVVGGSCRHRGRESWPNPYHLLLFLIGAIAMRGAGSTWNDILDRDIDAKVERTRARPLPAGELRPRAAVVLMGLLSLLGAAVLATFNGFSIGLGLASLAVVAIYPLMKRITFWPQAVLGLAFAWGALMGWAAVFGSLDWPPLLLYAGAIAWTIAYDTIYALQDLRDNSIIGVRSTARLFGGRVRLAVGSFQALAVILVTLSLVLVRGNVFGYLGCAGFAAHLAWQTASIDIDRPAKALMLFRSNWAAGLILFAGLVADAFFASA